MLSKPLSTWKESAVSVFDSCIVIGVAFLRLYIQFLILPPTITVHCSRAKFCCSLGRSIYLC